MTRKIGQLCSLLGGLLLASPVLAKGDGITGFSGKSGSTCSSCHGSTPTSSVTLGGPTTLAPGSSGSFTLTITRASSTRTSAGLDVAASGGTLAKDPAETLTALSSGEIIHTAPKTGAASVTFAFRWSAPSVAGTYTLYAAGIRGDGKSSSGDETGHTTLSIKVASAAPDAKVPLPDAKLTVPDAKVPLPDAKVAPKPDLKPAGAKPDLKTALPDAAAPKLDGAAKIVDAKAPLADAKAQPAEAKVAAADRAAPPDGGSTAAGDGAAADRSGIASPDAARPPASSDDGGCSLAARPRSADGGLFLLALLCVAAAAVIGARRRRR